MMCACNGVKIMAQFSLHLLHVFCNGNKQTPVTDSGSISSECSKVVGGLHSVSSTFYAMIFQLFFKQINDNNYLITWRIFVSN